MANLARFAINGSPSSAGGYDVNPGESLTLALEASASLVSRVTYEVHSTDSASPRATPGSATLLLNNSMVSGQSIDATRPSQPVTCSGFPTIRGAHLWEIRCLVDGGIGPNGAPHPDYVFSRFVAMRNSNGARKIMYSERFEYSSAESWAEAFNALVETSGSGAWTTVLDLDFVMCGEIDPFSSDYGSTGQTLSLGGLTWQVRNVSPTASQARSVSCSNLTGLRLNYSTDTSTNYLNGDYGTNKTGIHMSTPISALNSEITLFTPLRVVAYCPSSASWSWLGENSTCGINVAIECALDTTWTNTVATLVGKSRRRTSGVLNEDYVRGLSKYRSNLQTSSHINETSTFIRTPNVVGFSKPKGLISGDFDLLLGNATLGGGIIAWPEQPSRMVPVVASASSGFPDALQSIVHTVAPWRLVIAGDAAFNASAPGSAYTALRGLRVEAFI